MNTEHLTIVEDQEKAESKLVGLEDVAEF